MAASLSASETVGWAKQVWASSLQSRLYCMDITAGMYEARPDGK
eukprot:CAMPEP_0178994162 /NCGR_PEP_ID=MMETSP0795-20121207/7119_1 /TAXON_ID=88552 /ORGANISM="Amoebophrya sp., Strain Ameob2" /LENGTH=43 /DNA_ID= /DNA_START= /DNA_END= /DNA_ORIENTATION=